MYLHTVVLLTAFPLGLNLCSVHSTAPKQAVSGRFGAFFVHHGHHKIGAVGMKMREITPESVPLFKNAQRISQSLKGFVVLLARQSAKEWLAALPSNTNVSPSTSTKGALSPLLTYTTAGANGGALGQLSI